MLRDPNAHPSYSQEGEDLLLQRILHGVDRGFYVDVGAHHPWRFSNTYLFYQRGWTGINVEPNPDAQSLFAAHRSRDTNINCGIAETAGSLNYYSFDEPALNTFDESIVRDRQANTGYKLLGSQRVPVQRLESVLREHVPRGRRIDFLTVDVEGLDLAVLRSNDWENFRPRVVLAEALGSTLEDVLPGDMCGYMRSLNYVVFAKTYNTLFFVERNS